MNASDRSRPRSRFFVVLVGLALLGAALATVGSGFGRADTWPHLAFGLRGRSHVVLFGNSVNRTRSHCDTDVRDLASMVQDELGRSVRDVSSGGMHASEHVAYARLLVRRRAARTLIVPLPPGSLDRALPEEPKARARVLAYTTLASGPLAALQAWLASDSSSASEPAAAPARSPRDAEYGQRRDALMQAEKNAERCPEQTAANREFMRFMYRERTGKLQSETRVPSALSALASEARAAEIELLVYIPPFPLDLLEREGLHAERERFERYVRGLQRALAPLDARVVDLHAALPSESFTDLWCACGHLSQAGRQGLAARLARELREEREPSHAR